MPAPIAHMTEPSADKLTVLWQKGRNYFSTFFAELAQVRREMGNDVAFARWCVTDLHISMGVLTNVSEILKKADADLVKAELANARLEEQRRKAAERAALAQARAAEQAARVQEKAKREAERARKEQEKKVAEQRDKKQKRDQEYRQRQKAKTLAAYAASATSSTYRNSTKGQNLMPIPDTELAERIRAACARLVNSRAEWIEASLELAVLLCDGRKRCGDNDRAFGEWLDRNKIPVGRDDRAALINLGSNLQAMRLTLEKTDSNSYQLIWRNAQRRLLIDEGIG